MVGIPKGGLVLAVLLTVACSGTTIEATAPETVATAPTTATPTTAPLATTEPTPSTTTVVDRVAEIQAIIEDLEVRRLDALYREDTEAFREVFASEGYYEASLGAFDEVEFLGPPELPIIEVSEVLLDAPDCLAVKVHSDNRANLGPDAVSDRILVLQPLSVATWGFAYSGDGWLCDSADPFGGE